MKKYYTKPTICSDRSNTGAPTVLAVGLVGAVVGAASVAVGKMVGDIQNMRARVNSNQQIIGGLYA